MLVNRSEVERFETLPNGLRACVDWISFTILPTRKLQVSDLIHMLGFCEGDFIKTPSGANGYRSMLKLQEGNMRILYDGAPNMGIHVDISASAISSVLYARQKKCTIQTPFGGEAIEYSDFGYSLLLDMLNELFPIAKFTRIDLAIDDLGCNYYSCDDIRILVENRQIVSRFKSCDVRTPCHLADGLKEGETICFGSRKSSVFLRVYNKQLEIYKKHGEKPPFPWVRWELELKDERANEAVRLLLETYSLSTVSMGVLKNYIRFIEWDNNVKSRCSNEPTWDAFMENFEKISVYIPEPAKTLEDKKRWVDETVGATLSAIIEAYGGSMEFIYENLQKWQEKRKRNPQLTSCLIQALEKKDHE